MKNIKTERKKISLHGHNLRLLGTNSLFLKLLAKAKELRFYIDFAV